MATQQQNYTLGRGRLFFDRLMPDGTYTGERYLGNTPEFALSASSETLEHYNSDEGIRSRDRNVVTQINYTGSYTTDNVVPENLALMFLGSSEVLTQAAAPGQTSAFTNLKAWNWYQLGASDASPSGVRSVSNVTVADDAGTVTGITEGTDYELDATLARFQVLEGGKLDGLAAITVTYDVDAASRTRVVSGSQQVTGRLRFIAANPQGDQADYFMPSVTMSANGDFSLKAESDWQAIPFSLEISKTETQEAIYVDGRPYTA